MSRPESFYALLQVDPAAEPEVIDAAYRRLSRKYHPDVNPSPEASDRMRAINQAYATLRNPSRRAIYDRELRSAVARYRLKELTDLRPDPSQARRRSPAAERRGDLDSYRTATEPIVDRAAAALQRWAAEWSEALEAVVFGDPGGRARAFAAGQRCLEKLTEALSQWEAIAPPSLGRRLGELGAACLRLELALVRGSLTFAEAGDFSVLVPLAGLAERIGRLTRTIAAERIAAARAAA